MKRANLGPGVNLANMLDAPNEGDWGLVLQESYFDSVVEAGFEHVRLPVSWTYHTSLVEPFTISELFLQRIDEVLEQALQRDLKIILNVQHYDQLHADPIGERPRAIAMWSQIAARYQNLPAEKVFFEILNEPHGVFAQQPELWNQHMAEALAVIRQTNPTRKVIVGPVFFNSVHRLDSFAPPADPNLIATIHYYEPFTFTHQGAEWTNPRLPTGQAWVAEEHVLAGVIQDWSWNTTFESTTSGLDVTFNAPYSGFHIRNPNGFDNAQSLSFTVDTAMNLTIAVINDVGADSNNEAEAFYPLATTDGTRTYTIDISEFGNQHPVTNIFIQNQSDNPSINFNLSSLTVKSSNRTHPIIVTSQDRIRRDFAIAFRWGIANKMPIYLGEFGTYHFTEMQYRTAWTQAVRQTAERFFMEWGYWDFAAGFGVFDPDTNQFREPLLDSLMNGSK